MARTTKTTAAHPETDATGVPSEETTELDALRAEIARLQAEVAKPASTRKPRTTATPLDAQEAEDAFRVARPAEAPCLCGCGELTKGRFFPGHDAKLKARLIVTTRDGDATAAEFAAAALEVYGWTPEEEGTEAS
jgi:hypothetical protein